MGIKKKQKGPAPTRFPKLWQQQAFEKNDRAKYSYMEENPGTSLVQAHRAVVAFQRDVASRYK